MDSKHPDERLVFAFLDGDLRAQAILDSWRVQLPVTIMSAAALAELSDRCRCEFAFPRPEENDGLQWTTADEDQPHVPASHSAYVCLEPEVSDGPDDEQISNKDQDEE